MEFEWDEAKRLQALAKHGLNFHGVRQLFEDSNLMIIPSPRGGEERWIGVGKLDGKLVAVVWCLRDEKHRIITLRSARDEEKRKYRQLYGG